MEPGQKESIFVENDARKVFKELGTCSQAFTYILNREFGYKKNAMEIAVDPLAGGIMGKGFQCGMLWGSSLAVGAESYRRFDNRDEAIGVAIKTTQYLIESYFRREKTINCREVTKCDWSSRLSRVKYFLTGRFLHCFKLAEKWAPEAIEAASEGLSNGQFDIPEHPVSCASEVVKKMGASDEEMVMVAGFAGGLGLSGNACGALSAAIWINTIAFNKENISKPVFLNPKAENTLKVFLEATDAEMLCHKICGHRFKTLKDHANYINEGGCRIIMDMLSKA